MAPVIVDPDRVRQFEHAAAFADWLAIEHDQQPEVWIRIFKKASGVESITPLEAIDVALCWGWIDAIRKRFDEISFLQRYTPRGAKSLWSQVNRVNVQRLILAGRMTPFGARHVDAAKADGRWAAAYAPGSAMVMPEDLIAAIAANPSALATLQTLNAQNRFALAFRVGNLKTPAGRSKKIATFVAMLAAGQTIYPNGKGKPK